jgi:hypothetical protein
LNGTIPTQLGELPLERLNIAQNLISGTLPSELGCIQNIETLWIHSNLLTGSIPTQWNNLTKIFSL